MKKIVLGITVCALTLTLSACGASNMAFGHSLDSKMNDLHKTITSMPSIANSQLALHIQDNDKIETDKISAINTNPYGYPYAPNGLNGYWGGYGYGMPYGFGGWGMPYGINTYNPYMFGGQGYNPNGFGRYTNIDTYRINKLTEDGQTKTTIDTYHNGDQTSHDEYVENQNSTDTTSNFQTICETCFISNIYNNQLKDDILENIDEVKDIAENIKNSNNIISNKQIRTANELLDNIVRTQSKINMNKFELSKQFKNLQSNKNTFANSPEIANTKYVKLLSALDTHNSYLQSILNSLLQVENCIGNSCANGIVWNGINTNPDWIKSCPHGECINCSDCNSCSTCTGCNSCTNSGGCIDCTNCKECLLCTDCENCEGCFNCKDCVNCTNLANVTGYRNNMPCEDCNEQSSTENSQNSISNDVILPDTDAQTPNIEGSTGSKRIDNGQASISQDTASDNNQFDNNPQTEPVNADDTVKENLLDNPNITEGEYLEADTQMQTENSGEIKSFTEDESIFNQNEHENNKALTA